MGIKELKGALMFVCNGEFWRMGVIWTISLIRSYFNLFLQTHFARKSKLYDRSPPSVSSASASIRKPLCIITGATSGLGAAVSYALAKEGYYIVLGRLLNPCFPDTIKKCNAILILFILVKRSNVCMEKRSPRELRCKLTILLIYEFKEMFWLRYMSRVQYDIC